MSWGTFDTNEHTPKTDLSGRVETTWDGKAIHKPETTGGPTYTLPEIGHLPVPVPPLSSDD